jgi:enoyl-CoA hydratase/carnithine racemase
MATTVPRRDRVLGCVISAADRGSTLDHDGMLRAMTAMRDPGPGTGAILLTGGGANFCTGADVGAFAAAGHAVGPAAGAEGREGVRAFSERRPPRFHDEPVRANGGEVG